MTAEQWQAYGYEVIEDQGLVYLIREVLGIGYVIDAENGSWTRHQNINRLPWRFIDLRKHPRVLEIARMKSLKQCA